MLQLVPKSARFGEQNEYKKVVELSLWRQAQGGRPMLGCRIAMVGLKVSRFSEPPPWSRL
jgi:hypothetical protein